MSKIKSPSKDVKLKTTALDKEIIKQEIRNDLAFMLFGNQGFNAGFNPNGLPVFPNGAYGSQAVSQQGTLFQNMRWYLVSNNRQLLSELYAEIGVIQTIVDVPIEDALRGGVTITSKQLSEEEILELKNSVDEDDDITVMGQGTKWARLYGGGGVILLTDQDPEEPFDINSITPDTPVQFRAADLWELFGNIQNVEDLENLDPTVTGENFDKYNYHGEQIHRSRVLRLRGPEAPSFVRPRLRGWGMSVVESMVRSVNQYFKATDVAFELLDEFKVDVFKVKNLINSLFNPEAENAVRRRIAMANQGKNYQHALVMDTEDEWDHKQISFSGFAEVMKEIRGQLAADVRFPQTKLFGQSAAGFNSGEDDIEVYNAMVESSVRNKIKRPIIFMLKVKCQKLFGFVPTDLAVEFKPLRVLGAKDEEEVKTQKFNRLMQARQAGEINALEFREGCNKDNLLSISLDTEDSVISAVESGEYKSQPVAAEGKPGEEKKPGEKTPPKKKVENSDGFDLAAYKAQGGDGWIDQRRLLFMDKNRAVDQGLWDQAIAASRRIYGKEHQPFMVWKYQREGGSFYNG